MGNLLGIGGGDLMMIYGRSLGHFNVFNFKEGDAPPWEVV